MNFRATSKVRQWTLWLCAALAAVAVYVVVSRFAFGSVSWAVCEPHRQRLVLPLLLLFWLFAWETRWDGVKRKGKSKSGKEKSEDEKTEAVGLVGEPSFSTSNAQPATDQSSPVRRRRKNVVEKRVKGDLPVESSNVQVGSQEEADPRTGKELFDQARVLPHRPIPDFRHDAEYLGLLGASAAKGYAPALAKLGEYALRRQALVEAYYWMKMAEREGMRNMRATLREIRCGWALRGYPNQSSSVHDLFSREKALIGRAFLCVDSGHDAYAAKKYLKTHHPDLL